MAKPLDLEQLLTFQKRGGIAPEATDKRFTAGQLIRVLPIKLLDKPNFLLKMRIP